MSGQSALPTAEPETEARHRILRERAAVLAEPEAELAQEGMPVVGFTLGGASYAVETSFVSEVFLLNEITRLPGAPAVIAGVVNRRGIILTLLDPRALLELPSEGIIDVHAAIVLRSDGVEAGLLADTLLGGTQLAPERIHPSPLTAECVRGITPDGITLLDAPRIFSDPRIALDTTAAAATGAPRQ